MALTLYHVQWCPTARCRSDRLSELDTPLRRHRSAETPSDARTGLYVSGQNYVPVLKDGDTDPDGNPRNLRPPRPALSQGRPVRLWPGRQPAARPELRTTEDAAEAETATLNEPLLKQEGSNRRVSRRSGEKATNDSSGRPTSRASEEATTVVIQ